MSTCHPIQGNPDFYGLGIRIGIYLQWSSAWLNLLLDPESAQSVLDTNSVFVFAVVIATIIADRRDAPPIEIYILLQILLGFPITTLSSFGIRLWLMTPSRLKKLLDTLSEEWSKYQKRIKQTFMRAPPDTAQRDRETTRTASDEREGEAGSQTLVRRWAKWAQKTLEQSQGQATTTAALPYNVLSALKFPGLSWSGVAWRTATVSLVAVFNEVYWFGSVFDPSEDPQPSECGPPVVFLFSKQPLEGAIVSLGKAAGIIIVALVAPPAYTLLALMLQIFWFGLVILLRDTMKLWGPSVPNSLGSSLKRINHLLEAEALPILRSLQYYSRVLPANTIAMEVAQSFLDLLVFISTSPTENDIRFSDVLKFLISLGMGKPSMPPPRHGDTAALPAPAVRAATTMSEWENKRHVEGGVIYSHAVWNVHLLTFANRLGRSMARLRTRFCIAWNIYTVLTIVWFILSIELTIRWNSIQGVNSVDSTGQLIPLIIGCVSASQVLKKVVLLALAKKYPDWVNLELSMGVGIVGPVITKIGRTGDTGNGVPEENHDDRAQNGIQLSNV